MKQQILILSLCVGFVWGCTGADVEAEAEPKPTGAMESAAAQSTLNLAEYRLVRGPIEIEGLSDNLSGLAFDVAATALLAVVDYPPEVLQLSLEGKILDRYELGGGADMEAVEYIAADRFLVADEGAGVALAFRFMMTEDRGRQIAESPDSAVTIDRSFPANRGLEGLAWDPAGRRVFAVKEKKPVRLFEVTIPEEVAGGDPVVSVLWDFADKGIAIDDASGLHWDAVTGHLMILSDESKCLIECTPDGREIARLALPDLAQPEGVALGEDRTLYVVGEPNQMCIYRRTAPDE